MLVIRGINRFRFRSGFSVIWLRFFLTLVCNLQFEVNTYTLLFAADYFYGLFFYKICFEVVHVHEGQSIKACRLHTINKEMGIYWNLVFWSAGES